MPVMPRVPGKSTKIAYKVMGIPSNMLQKKDKAQQKINQRLNFEETIRSR